jgi:hypothetical protein
MTEQFTRLVDVVESLLIGDYITAQDINQDYPDNVHTTLDKVKKLIDDIFEGEEFKGYNYSANNDSLTIDFSVQYLNHLSLEGQIVFNPVSSNRSRHFDYKIREFSLKVKNNSKTEDDLKDQAMDYKTMTLDFINNDPNSENNNSSRTANFRLLMNDIPFCCTVQNILNYQNREVKLTDIDVETKIKRAVTKFITENRAHDRQRQSCGNTPTLGSEYVNRELNHEPEFYLGSNRTCFEFEYGVRDDSIISDEISRSVFSFNRILPIHRLPEKTTKTSFKISDVKYIPKLRELVCEYVN